MINVNYNPDVLDAIANLSNDEVFTPPKLVNEILDMLPQELFESKTTTFLDPVSKSGVFLREIAKRLMKGLKTQIPDKQERANHILKNQLFGIAITELTSLLSRRSVYGTKKANGKFSFCTEFDNEQGNIVFDNIQHIWASRASAQSKTKPHPEALEGKAVKEKTHTATETHTVAEALEATSNHKDKCIFCGASREVYDRADSLETYAYQFIHTNKPEKIFNMKFDVIIGNPPYQLSDGGFGKSAKPIYHKFVEQSKKLNPRYLTMIIPARWYNGGKGLDEFRENMLNDDRMAQLHDFPDTSDCFPGLNIRGGVCYFLWEKEHTGDCEIFTHKGDKTSNPMKRPLLEKGLDIFIRYNEAISILKKVQEFNEKPFNVMVSSRKPFGLATNFKGFKSSKTNKENIKLYRFGDNGYISLDKLEKNHSFVNDWKIFVPYSSPGDDSYPHLILSKPIVAGVNTCCTETYLVIGPVSSEVRAKNIANYMITSFFRFMILLAKSTQHITQKTYVFVPMQNFDELWTDEKLYEKYGITKEEQEFINTLIRPMDISYE